jgi:hypothetical protein
VAVTTSVLPDRLRGGGGETLELCEQMIDCMCFSRANPGCPIPGSIDDLGRAKCAHKGLASPLRIPIEAFGYQRDAKRGYS